MRIRVLIVAFAICGRALGQEPLAPTKRGELGVRWWVSSGETKRSHNAQPVDPTLGNPTSVLLYENLDANVFELFGRQNFHGNWFLKGFLGVGQANRGSFDDEDFEAGQVKFSDTTSSVTQGNIGYGAIDVGRNEWVFQEGRSTIGIFIGYSQWTESVDAYGATDHIGFIGGDISRDVKVITNKVVWKAARVGFAADLALGARTRLDVDLALIPYARVRNEDSHHLRTDPSQPDFLGPVPNIILEGEGRGIQFDAELRYEIRRRTELGLGFRYWYLETTKGDRSVPAFPGFPELPLVELYSTRVGATLSLRRVW